MKLVASMIVAEVEYDRYLEPCLRHLLAFCDEIALWLDGHVAMQARPEDRFGGRVLAGSSSEVPLFYEHEGKARQAALDYALTREPTHVLAIDADEFVADGRLLRQAVQADPRAMAWTLCMQEVWDASRDMLLIRQDGGWEEHDAPILWKVPHMLDASYRLPDKAMASGRVPTAVGRLRRGCGHTEVLHFGWANESERKARHARYVKHDGGRFHASSHLASIMWPRSRVKLAAVEWPSALDQFQPEILELVHSQRT